MENILDVLMFTVNEKVTQSQKNMISNSISSTGQENKYMFDKGQYQAYSEIYTMLINLKNGLD